MLWFVRDAAAAEPWLPTVAEQDARWLEVHSERVEQLRNNHQSALAIGGMR